MCSGLLHCESLHYFVALLFLAAVLASIIAVAEFLGHAAVWWRGGAAKNRRPSPTTTVSRSRGSEVAATSIAGLVASAYPAGPPTDVKMNPTATPREPMVVEVAWLMARGRLGGAVDLLLAVRTATRPPREFCHGGAAPPRRGSVTPVVASRTMLSPAAFRVAMQYLARSRSPKAFFYRVVEEMCFTGLPRDALTENCCIRYLCRAPGADVNDALCAYTSMLATGITPDLRTVECLVDSCLRARRPDIVKELVLSLEEIGLRATGALYASLITAYALTGAVACGLATLEQMKWELGDDSAAARLCHISAIHMCAQHHQLERAALLYEQGRHAGLALGPELLAPLIAAAVQMGSNDFALQLVVQARADGAASPSSDGGLQSCGPVARVCALLEKRPGSRALAERMRSVLSGTFGAVPITATVAAVGPKLFARQPARGAREAVAAKGDEGGKVALEAPMALPPLGGMPPQPVINCLRRHLLRGGILARARLRAAPRP